MLDGAGKLPILIFEESLEADLKTKSTLLRAADLGDRMLISEEELAAPSSGMTERMPRGRAIDLPPIFPHLER